MAAPYVEAGCRNAVKDFDVMCGDGFSLRTFCEIFPEMGQDGGNAVRLLLTCRFQGTRRRAGPGEPSRRAGTRRRAAGPDLRLVSADGTA